jgi:hypothetical protein
MSHTMSEVTTRAGVSKGDGLARSKPHSCHRPRDRVRVHEVVRQLKYHKNVHDDCRVLQNFGRRQRLTYRAGSPLDVRIQMNCRQQESMQLWSQK